MYVDFAVLKEQVKIEQIVMLLGLPMQKKGTQWRGECGYCKSGGPRTLAVNTYMGSFYCFSAKKGGDAIALWAHVNNCPQRDAAEQIAKRLNIETVPTSSTPPAPRFPEVPLLKMLQERLLKEADDTKPEYLEAAVMTEDLIEKLEAL